MNTVDKMHLLMERMDHPMTALEAQELEEAATKPRQAVPVENFFDLVSKMGGSRKVTFGYLSGANLNIPQVKMMNPSTKRMKNYDDWDEFNRLTGREGKIGGIIKFSVYNMNWRGGKDLANHYNKNYVEPLNAVFADYGLPLIQKKENDYRQNINFSDNGNIKGYTGNNDELRNNTYSEQDFHGATVKAMEYYLIDVDGNIIGEPMTENDVKQFVKAADPIRGVAALRKLGKSDEEIKEYERRVMAASTVKFRTLKHSSFVFVKAEGQDFLNRMLPDVIGGVRINPEQFINIAKNRFGVSDI